MYDFTRLDPEDWLKLNTSLQQKKNALRKALKEKGILKRAGQNDFDHYKYFSEAQYKELFTELFSQTGLELKFNEVDYLPFDGPEKQANGRMVRLEFDLIDTETGFYETTMITGEGIDKGDKAGYKAYTGAIKYYLADTFLVATGDDPEAESPDEKMNTAKKATENQIATIRKIISETNIPVLLRYYNVEKLEDLTIQQASDCIRKKGAK